MVWPDGFWPFDFAGLPYCCQPKFWMKNVRYRKGYGCGLLLGSHPLRVESIVSNARFDIRRLWSVVVLVVHFVLVLFWTWGR